MIPVLIVLAIGIACVTVYLRSDVSDLFLAAGVVLSLFGLVCLIVAGSNQLGVGGDMAEIQTLRAAARDIGPAFGHDIYGRVADANVAIASARFYRHQWWSRFAVPAAWDTVSVIP